VFGGEGLSCARLRRDERAAQQQDKPPKRGPHQKPRSWKTKVAILRYPRDEWEGITEHLAERMSVKTEDYGEMDMALQDMIFANWQSSKLEPNERPAAMLENLFLIFIIYSDCTVFISTSLIEARVFSCLAGW
jgi:hypothetical protein